MPQAFSTSSLPPIKTKPQTELLIDDISSIGQPDISLSTIDSPAPTTPHVYGAIHVTKPLKLFLSLLLIVPLYSYYMAVSKK